MITAIHSNPNYDSKEVDKQQILEDMEMKFEIAIDGLYTTDEEKQAMEDDPFLKASKAGLEWTKEYETGHAQPEKNDIGMKVDIDQ